jgi:hypothetical protein
VSSALPAPAIPETSEEITAEWLTAVLRSRGVLDQASVRKVRHEVLGVGEGFIGQIIRLHLDTDPPEGPRKLIAKIPTGLGQNRALAEMMGGYEREIRFYEELADDVDLPTPRCYYTAMDPHPLGSDEKRARRVLRILERIPGWAMRMLHPAFLWLAGRSRRRYILLLEDLAPADVGDQVAGCTPEEAEPILRALAIAQAGLWESPKFESLYWLARTDMLTRGSHALFRRNRRRFLEQFGDRLPEFLPQLADWFDGNAIRLMKHLGSPPVTLMHGDYRLDNLFFSAAGRSSPAAIDWQGAGCCRAPLDVAYFITGNIEPELARPAESTLVRTYHDVLVSHGVKDYAFEECWRDYQLSKLSLMYRFMLGGEMIDLSHQRGQRLLDVVIGRLFALLPVGDPDVLLSSAR